MHVADIVLDGLAREPAAEVPEEELVCEIAAPERAVGDAGLGEGGVEVEHADEAGPLAAPVGDGEDRPAMRIEAGENVVGVLPDGFDDDERRFGRQFAEHLHAVLLAVDEAVAFDGVAGVAAAHLASFVPDGSHDGLFGLRLGRPADLIGGGAQISAGNDDDGFGHDAILTRGGGGVGWVC